MNEYLNILKYGTRNIYNKKIKSYRFNTNGGFVKERLLDFIDNIQSDTIVAFVGLKQIKYYAGIENPAEYMIDLLQNKFKSIIVPAYTASVRKSRFFDVKNTPSESGAFSNAFLKVADYRTPSPFRSFAIKGPIVEQIEKLQFANDFEKDGIYEFMHYQNIPTINVGADEIRFKSLHYLEYLYDVPYLKKNYIDISIVENGGEITSKKCFNLSYSRNFKINMDKISSGLIRNNLITEDKYKGLVLRYLPESNYYQYLLRNLKNDPLYFIN